MVVGVQDLTCAAFVSKLGSENILVRPLQGMDCFNFLVYDYVQNYTILKLEPPILLPVNVFYHGILYGNSRYINDIN